MFAELPLLEAAGATPRSYAGSLRFHLDRSPPTTRPASSRWTASATNGATARRWCSMKPSSTTRKTPPNTNRIILLRHRAAADPGLGHRLQPLSSCNVMELPRPPRTTQATGPATSIGSSTASTRSTCSAAEEAQPQALLPAEMGLLRPGTGFHPRGLEQPWRRKAPDSSRAMTPTSSVDTPPKYG